MYKVRTTIDNKLYAKRIASRLVAGHAAASVHVRPVDSVYGWKGAVNYTTEYEVEALCDDEVFTMSAIKAMHTYECPEVISEAIRGSEDIEKWCRDWCFHHDSLNRFIRADKENGV